MIKYLTVVTGDMYCENCYIVYNEKNDGFIIDPGDDFEILDEVLVKNNINLNAILLTHGHFDHVGAVKELIDKYDLKVYMNFNDKMLLGFMRESDFIPDVDIKNQDYLEIASIKIKCINTPGHSEGSTCYIIENLLFSGDTLFAGSIGRCDLPGGNAAVMLKTLKDIVMNFDNDLKVLSGHGEESTIRKEKTTNYYLKNL